MDKQDQLIAEIMVMVSSAKEQRARPHELQKTLSKKFDVPMSRVQKALAHLVEEEKLVFTYRDPCSYVEIPYSETSVSARPMKVLVDSTGEPWICDADVDPSVDLAGQGCWRCGDLGFTRSG